MRFGPAMARSKSHIEEYAIGNTMYCFWLASETSTAPFRLCDCRGLAPAQVPQPRSRAGPSRSLMLAPGSGGSRVRNHARTQHGCRQDLGTRGGRDGRRRIVEGAGARGPPSPVARAWSPRRRLAPVRGRAAHDGLRRAAGRPAVHRGRGTGRRRGRIFYRSTLKPIFTVTWNSCTLFSAILPRCSTTSNQSM